MKFYLRITNLNNSVFYVEHVSHTKHNGRLVVGAYITNAKSRSIPLQYDDAVDLKKRLIRRHKVKKIEIVGRVKAEGRKI